MKADVSVIHGPGEVPGLPFSSAVRVGDLLFLSGQIGNVPGTRQLADGGIAGQTRQVLENIKAVLAFAGSSLDRARSEEHTSELQSPCNLVWRLLLEKKKKERLRALES